MLNNFENQSFCIGGGGVKQKDLKVENLEHRWQWIRYLSPSLEITKIVDTKEGEI